MREEKETVRAYYDADPQREWDRLQKRFPYEKYITVHMMDRYIRPGSAILDIGGGPGQYSIHFAKQGHSVTLLDLSGENVRFAKKKARQYGVKITAVQGDAMDLSRFPDNAFDTVFLMGPLYHLMNEESRLRSVREAARVLRPGGTLFSSFILMYGGVIYGLREARETIFQPEEQEYFDWILFPVCGRKRLSARRVFLRRMHTFCATARKKQELPGMITRCVFAKKKIT